MAKFELFEHKQFGWLIRNLNAFPIRRGEADVSAIKEAIHRLQEGRILTMFPEGTRTRDGSIGRIQPGIARLIRRAEVPVIPGVIDGAYLAWPRGQKMPHAHPVRVAYGPALDLQGIKGTEIVPLIQRTLESMLADLRRRDPAFRRFSAE
jgi:1-acyl-sn-glycerol-3-phosphate acyltransferase